jgi:hypothetical protein
VSPGFAFYTHVQEIVSMARIFVSYRREDSSGYAGRLFDSLHPYLGRDRIYMDVVANEPGIDFVKTIEAALKACRVLIVLIGKKWVNLTDASGRRRLDNPDDFVRLEVAAAIKRGARIIPVLVGGAAMPNASELPPELKSLTRFQALEISDSRWDHDLGRLVEILKKIGKRPRALPMMAGIVFMAIVLVVGLDQVGILSNESIAHVLLFNLRNEMDLLLNKLKKPDSALAPKPAKKYPILLSAGAGTQTKAGPGTYKILTAQLDQYSAEKLTLSFKMRYTRDNSWSGGALTSEQFRLIVDDETLAPTQAPSELVEKNSSKNCEVVFVIPRAARIAVLQVGETAHGTKKFIIDLHAMRS